MENNSRKDRFEQRIWAVLALLLKFHQQGVLAERPASLSPIDRIKAQWGKDWLASYWRLLPFKSGSQE